MVQSSPPVVSDLSPQSMSTELAPSPESAFSPSSPRSCLSILVPAPRADLPPTLSTHLQPSARQRRTLLLATTRFLLPSPCSGPNTSSRLMVILDPTPDSHRMYSTFPQPSSFAHSRKGSYPGPPLTLAGVGATGGGLGGQTMLGGGGFSHRRSGSDISLPGGMGAVGTGLIELGGGYDLGEHAQWGASGESVSRTSRTPFSTDQTPTFLAPRTPPFLLLPSLPDHRLLPI